MHFLIVFFRILSLALTGFHSLDYYPLLPWGALFLYGAALGKLIFSARPSQSTRLPQPQPFWARPLSIAGRHSLAIYLVHQPVLIGLLWLAHQFR